MLAINSDRFLECVLGILWGGGVVCPLNSRWNMQEAADALHDSGANIFIADDSFNKCGAVFAKDGLIKTLIHIGESATPPGFLDYEALIDLTQPVKDVHRHGDDLAMLLYTGGTTGTPKGVMLSHTNIGSASLGMLAMGCGTEDIHLHAVPMFHIAGVQMFFNHMLRAGTHVVLPAFDPLAAVKLIEAEAVGSLMLVPAMLQMMIVQPEIEDIELSSLKRVFYGASPISETALLHAMEALPEAEFIQGYGMTETGITLMLPGHYHTREGRGLNKLRSAGYSAPAAEVRIVDEEGQEAPPGKPGEIQVRGPMIMQGYWNQPQMTEEVFSDGWLRTGDVAKVDEDGFFFIVDRIKDMIVSGGENVYSTEVENAIATHDAVASCAVIGISHEKWGESVHAVVVAKPGLELDQNDIINHCKNLISSYKCPRSVEFREEMPLSAAGKLLKHKLRDSF